MINHTNLQIKGKYFFYIDEQYCNIMVIFKYKNHYTVG